MSLTRDAVAGWLNAYVEAWRSYDRAAIGELFSDDCEYRYHPYDEPVRGREAIVDSWLREPDDPSIWTAAYEPVAIDGDVAVATGESAYSDDDTAYFNCFVMRFADDGRCREFTEYFVQQPK